MWKKTLKGVEGVTRTIFLVCAKAQEAGHAVWSGALAPNL